jgi:hypothetical protein
LTKGEAVVVDLGKRGVLFALMTGPMTGSDYGIDVVKYALPFTDSNGNPSNGATTKEIIDHYSHLKEKKILTVDDYPMFVHFKDINNPKTVENVLDFERVGDQYPIHYRIKADHTAKMFGQGVKIKEITLEMIDEPMTWGIEKWLPWLPQKKDISGVIGSTLNNPIYEGSLGLTGVEFSMGRFW